VTQLINDSKHVPQQVFWFSTLVSKASNLPLIQSTLKKAGVFDSRVVEMSQGQKQSRFVAWTFLDNTQQRIWREKRWAAAKA
jgi:23S rRNA (adenine1618-N6)-methyltransferase